MRGLAHLLTMTSPGRLLLARQNACYVTFNSTRLKGITKKLERMHSGHDLPRPSSSSSSSLSSSTNHHGRERNASRFNGRRRGIKVDNQVSRIFKTNVFPKRMYKLTRNILHTLLDVYGFQAITAQRVVADEAARLGTAIDLVCYDPKDSSLVLIELKSGFAGNRQQPVVDSRGVTQHFKPPLSKIVDCTLHRHFLQLAVTSGMFLKEKGTLRALKAKGVSRIKCGVLYSTNEGTEFFLMSEWWLKRASKIRKAI
jgi:hypothetical protein